MATFFWYIAKLSWYGHIPQVFLYSHILSPHLYNVGYIYFAKILYKKVNLCLNQRLHVFNMFLTLIVRYIFANINFIW